MPYDYTDKTALITGASSGIGVEFASKLAVRGANLILVARREDRLQQVAADLTKTYKIRATAIAADLALPNAAVDLFKQLKRKKLSVDVLINNAGFGTIGRFDAMDEAKITDQIRLNVLALVELTRQALPSMLERNSGVVLNIASTASYQPVPYMAVYAATKAFVLSFTEALWGELRGTNVHALALSPGGTKTEFFEVASNGKTRDGFGKMQTVDQVVEVALNALDAATPPPSVISGTVNRIMAGSGRLVTRKTVLSIATKLFKPKD